MRSQLFVSALTIALAVVTPIGWAIAFPKVAVAQSVVEQKKEADRLFSLGLKKNEEIEKLRESSRNLYIEDIELRDKFPEKWRNNLTLKSAKISNQVHKIRAEIVRDYLRALVIYQKSRVKTGFPLESLQSEQKILIELIEIDFDDRIGSEKLSYLIEPQVVRNLAIRILGSYQNPDFCTLFPVESHSGEQNIIIKLMNPSSRFPYHLIREEIFENQEILTLLEKILENSRNTNFRNKFPLESRLGEQKVLTELSPYDRSIYQRRYLLSSQKRLNFWRNLRDSYLDPKFVSAFPNESRQGEGNALIKMGWTSLFEMNQPKQALSFLKQGSSIAHETGDLLLVSETMGLIVSVYWNLGEYQEVIQSYEKSRKIIREISTRIIDKSDSIINEKLLKLNSRETKRLVKELQKLEFSWTYSTATAHLALGEPKRAIELYQEFFAVTKDNPELNSFRQGRISNLGIAHWLSGQYEEAIQIYTQLHNKGFSYYPLDYSLIMVGRGYANMAKYKQAIDFHEKELKRAEKDLSYNLQIASLYNLAEMMTGVSVSLHN